MAERFTQPHIQMMTMSPHNEAVNHNDGVKKTAVLALATFTTAAMVGVAPAIAADAPLAATDAQPCSWWIETSLANSNVFYPDTSAAYWTMGYGTDEVDEITLSGEYPNARYFARQAYGGDAQLFKSPGGQLSAITDFEIAPDPDSINPWVNDAAAGGAWTLTLSDTKTGQNVLPLSPQQAVEPLIPGTPADLNFLMMRIYVPTGSFNAMPLPEVTLHYKDGSTELLSQCTKADRKVLAKTKAGASLVKALTDRKNPPIPDCGNDCPPELESFKVQSLATPFPNASSAYIGALFTPQKGRVVVMRATMPTTPSGTTPEVWPAGKDLRYWSFCNYVYTSPYPAVVVGRGENKVVGCTADYQTPSTRGAAGNQVTLVLSFPSDKKRIDKRLAKSKAMTWLPMSARYGTTQEFIALRNMLPNPAFAQSATSIEVTNDPAAAEAVMGEYYPQVAMCSARKLARQGAAACLAG